MKKSAITILFLITTNILAFSNSYEQKLIETVTETYKFKNGIYERIALKRIGSEKVTFTHNSEESDEISNEFLGEEELIGEKYLIPLSSEVKFKIHVDGTDDFRGFDNEFSFPAEIKVNGNKIQRLLISEENLTNYIKGQFENMLKLQVSSVEIPEENIQIEFLKIKTTALKCLPKNGKLYCQYKLKFHGKSFGSNI